MTKTIWILAIAAAFVLGSIATGTIAYAGDDEDDEDDEGGAAGSSGSAVYRVSATAVAPPGVVDTAEAFCEPGDFALHESFSLSVTPDGAASEPHVVGPEFIPGPLFVHGPDGIVIVTPNLGVQVSAVNDLGFFSETITAVASANCVDVTP